jgi:RHS repeat-associated protein
MQQTGVGQRIFIGQFSDDSGLSYLNARYYSSDRGQFISQDPMFWGKQNLTNPQSFNSYSYANDKFRIISRLNFGKNVVTIGWSILSHFTSDHNFLTSESLEYRVHQLCIVHCDLPSPKPEKLSPNVEAFVRNHDFIVGVYIFHPFPVVSSTSTPATSVPPDTSSSTEQTTSDSASTP